MINIDSKKNSNRNSKHILLVSDNGISNQFIQQEIEKTGYFSLEKKCSKEITKSEEIISSDLVLISYQNIVEFSGNNVSLTNILSNKWIIYDVPKEIGEKALAEMQLMHFLNLKGLIYQDAPIEHFTRCLKTVSDEDLWLPRKVMTQMLFEIRPYALNLQVTQASTNLTKREIQIFKRLIKGASNLEISEDLFIAESTVKTHLYNIYKKMNVNNRKQAIKKARFIYDYSSYNSSKH